MEKTVSLLIPVRFNCRWTLDICLRTIRKYTNYPYKVIIGDAGVDEEAAEFLKLQNDVQVVKCPDPLRPKDYLARKVDTPYFMFLHDDVQILRDGWLKRRVDLIEKNKKIGIVGTVVCSYTSRLKRVFAISPVYKRFFPFALLVRKEVQDELDLVWGPQAVRGFDTGGIAYLQFIKQKRWHFINCNYNHDVRHFGNMTWVVKKQILGGKIPADLDKLCRQREKNLLLIKKTINENLY